MNKPLENTPIRPVAAHLVFKLALSVAPQGSRDWLEDMRLEAAFIESSAARLRWALGALWTAVRFRLATLSKVGRGPRVFALASAVMVAVVAVLIIVPVDNLKLSPTLSREQQEASPALADELLEPPASLQVPAETSATAPLSQAGEPKEQFQDSDAAADLETRALVPDALGRQDIEAEEATSLDAAAELALPSAPTAKAELNTLGVATERARSDDAQFTALSLSPSAVTEVLDGPVMLSIHSPVWLELAEGSEANRRLRVKGDVQSGESFELSLPFYIYTNNAGAISLSLAGQPPELLGPEGVALARLFKPRR